jgi:alanyl aminopeptidase
LRLPPGPRPTGYALDLRVDPAQSTFRGTVDIGLDLPGETGFVWLNGKALDVTSAEVISGSERVAATASAGGDEYLGFAFARPLAGRVTLRVAYTGHVGESGEGLYVQRAGDDRYLYTQLENTDARRLLPCFDEPSFKVPWQLTVHVPRGVAAFSNSHAVAEADEDGGGRRVAFAQTPPLPSYLIALVVGPFEIVGAGEAGEHRTPLRILLPRGRAAQGAYAASIAGRLVGQLEAYFGVPFPYDKLDYAARPEGSGAMENAGLIISGAGYLTAPLELQSDQFRRIVASVMAHEIAHQWFGDLVTLAWWDDVWLNEAFATWMGNKVFAIGTEWRPEVDSAQSRLTAMDADLLPSARQIRQPIRSEDDIANAFDGITYEKGATVIGMFERALGEERFRAGVRRYLEGHAHRTATTDDFLAAISAAAGRDVKPAFTTFLDQPGLPVVRAEAVCSGGTAKVALAQERFAAAAGAPGAAPARWRIPVCIKAGAGKKSVVACTELDGERGELALDVCPEWLDANAGNTGYYLARYPDAGLRALAAHIDELELAERLGLVHDLRVQLVAGTVPAGPALELVARLAKAGPTVVVAEAADLAADLVARGVVGPAHRAGYAAWIQRTFGARARAAGFGARAADTADDKELRRALLELVAVHGRDRALAAEARALAGRWLGDRTGLAADLVGPVLDIAAATGDAAFGDRLRAALAEASGYDRQVLLTALFALEDADAVARAVEILGTDEVKARDFFVLRDYAPAGAARPALFHYVRAHYDALAAKLGDDAVELLAAGRPLCDVESLREFKEFFAERAARVLGGPRTYAQLVERIEICIAARHAEEASLATALKGGR